VPVSEEYGDVYFSLKDGYEESVYTFLQGNDLPRRFKDKKDFTICELGFGSGLNFLASFKLWNEEREPGSELHYISIEKNPLDKSDMEKILASWPELEEVKKDLLASYPLLTPGFHLIEFQKQGLRLTLIFAEVLEALEQITGQIDAWYLDGFAPKKNPDMWRPELFDIMAMRSVPGATVATFSSVGELRRQLITAGFEMQKHKGYGHKRHMLKGQYRGERTFKNKEPWFILPGIKNTEKKAIVLGAGLSGAAAAFSLAQRGWALEVIDRAGIATEASGNPQAIFHPLPTKNTITIGEFYLRAFHYASKKMSGLLKNKKDLDLCGLVMRPQDEAEKKKQQEISDFLQWPEELMQVKEQGLSFPGSGWVSPRALCEAQLKQDNIKLLLNSEIDSIQRHEENWQCLNKEGEIIAEAPVLIMATANEALNFSQSSWLPLKTLRGQLTYLPENEKSKQFKEIICGQSYFLPALNGRHVLGASYRPEEKSQALKEEEHLENIEGLAEEVKQCFDIDRPEGLEGRVAFRSASADYLPLIGPLPDVKAFEKSYPDLHQGRKFKTYAPGPYLEGLYVSLGHGSRGVISGLFGGELLAAEINGESLPLEKDIVNALNPGRFLIRRLKRNEKITEMK
jgi:tRNA 5-methylaminomethyl-2-thiouridine biosynthesis bifunctional protein